MSRLKVFLIKAELGNSGQIKEGIMRLPVDRYYGITNKGMDMIRKRFLDGNTGIQGSMRYSLPIEQFSSAEGLMEALEKYQRNEI